MYDLVEDIPLTPLLMLEGSVLCLNLWGNIQGSLAKYSVCVRLYLEAGTRYE